MSNRTALLVMAAAATLTLTACDVEKTQDGDVTLPGYEVTKTREGNVTLPEYEVTTPDVTVEKKTVEVTVPDVDVRTAAEKKAGEAR